MADCIDTHCPTCKHKGFTDPAPPYGWRSNLFCKLHKKRITQAGCGGRDYVDWMKKMRVE